jgi:regulator of replication initiation timing
MKHQVNSIEEIDEMIKTYSPKWISLKAPDQSVIIPFNKNFSEFPKHLEKVKALLEDPRLPIGNYIIDIRAAKMKPGTILLFTNNTTQLSDQPQPIFEAQLVETKTKIVTDDKLLEIRVESERLKIENEILREENAQLLERLEELESVEPEPLQDSPNKFEKIVEVATPILDNILNLWKQSIETKQAALMVQNFQPQPQRPTPPVYKQSNELTLEEIEAVRQSAPYEFYNWIAQPGNRELYERLKMNSNV